MAGRTADISTSSFKPLSLNEIMMVPLAMQAKEDNLNQLALDEFSALQSNALGADKEYVTGQVEALKKESGSITDDLMSQGYSKNLFNKFRKLKSKKDNELSLMGKTGQAAAAYNQYEANKANIMRDPRLTADQKKLGLQEALGLYESSGGAAGGAQYQDYVGAAHINAMQKGRDIASVISPQEIAKKMGISQNEQGLYEENGYLTKTLSSETISEFVKQALEGDADLMAYANEHERLGLGSAEDMIAKAAESAGNLYQHKDFKDTSKLLPQYLQNSGTGLADTTKGLLANPPGQNWTSRWDTGTSAAFNEALNVPEDKSESEGWFDKDGMFTSQDQVESKLGIKIDRIEKPTAKELKEAKEVLADENAETIAKMKAGDLILRAKRYDKRVPNQEVKNLVKSVREKNIAFEGLKPDTKDDKGNVVKGGKYTDRDVYNIFREAKKNSVATASQLISPKNLKNSFIPSGQRLVGSDGLGVAGIISENIHLKLPDGREGGYAKIMQELGYGDDTARFMEDLKGGGSPAYSPGVPDMPGARVISFLNKLENKMVTMYAEPTIEEARAFQNVSEINNLIYSGDNFKKIGKSPGGGEQYAVAELHPETKKYEGATILTDPHVKLTRKDIPYIEYDKFPVEGRPGVYKGTINTSEDEDYDSPNNGQIVFKRSLNAEIQRGTDAINRYNDGTRNAVTNAKEGISYKR